MFNVKWGYPITKTLFLLILAPRGLDCKQFSQVLCDLQWKADKSCSKETPGWNT